MKMIPESELAEITASYGLPDLKIINSKQIGPDIAAYIFRDFDNHYYILLAADTLSGYSDVELPHHFDFDEESPYQQISFDAVARFNYIKNAPKAAQGYIDDDHILTHASTGDVCVLFGCVNLNIK